MQQQPETQVSPNAAWQAARERAMRTTEALIVAEARIVDLEAHVQELGDEKRKLLREYEQLDKWNTALGADIVLLQKRLRDYEDAYEGVKTNAAESEPCEPDTDAVSEAVHTHAFSD